MNMAATSLVRTWWDKYKCNPDRMANITFYDRRVGGVADVAVAAFAALEQVLIETGYKPTSVWAYNCRKIAGTNSMSLHSYGVAIDIDPTENPYTAGDPFAGKFTPAQVAAVEAIRSGSGRQLWTWGGRWSKPDRMHWQLNVPPADTSVDWSTVSRKEAQQVAVPLTDYEQAAVDRLLGEGVFTKYSIDEEGELDADVSLKTLAVFLSRVMDEIEEVKVSTGAVDPVARESIVGLLEYLRGV